MASRTYSRTRKTGTTFIAITAVSLVSGCMRDDDENVAEYTPAHGAQGVTANLGGGETIDGATTAETTAPVPLQDYVVQRGDTLSGLSTKFQVPVSAIKEANEMTNDIIFYGKKIKIPMTAPASNLAGGNEAEAMTSSPVIADKPSTAAPVSKPAEVTKTANAMPPPVPPAPPSITSPAPASKPEERRSLGAAFGGGDNGGTGTSEPRMPSGEGISPFYEQGSSGSTSTVPAVSGQPNPSPEASDVPLPRE